jgi:hypothetical protein
MPTEERSVLDTAALKRKWRDQKLFWDGPTLSDALALCDEVDRLRGARTDYGCGYLDGLDAPCDHPCPHRVIADTDKLLLADAATIHKGHNHRAIEKCWDPRCRLASALSAAHTTLAAERAAREEEKADHDNTRAMLALAQAAKDLAYKEVGYTADAMFRERREHAETRRLAQAVDKAWEAWCVQPTDTAMQTIGPVTSAILSLRAHLAASPSAAPDTEGT